ncbi:MAG: 2'-5' RNA ligase family protein [Lachnospiraceae bacterium]|nr:2'-5' RNA ligase family protein [Lachnospiraceae bacterium]
MYLITAYFDETTNKRLSHLLEEIADKTGNDFMTKNHVPPHLTIASFEQRSDEVALSLFEGVKKRAEGGEIFISSVGVFFPYVIYAEAVQNKYLQDLNQLVFEEISEHGDTIVSKFYQPMQWIPHITLGKKLSTEQMRLAFQILQEKFSPMEAKIVSFGLAKPNPHRDFDFFEIKE